MRLVAKRLAGSVLAVLTASTGAMAQSYYDDPVCRKFADAQTAPVARSGQFPGYRRHSPWRWSRGSVRCRGRRRPRRRHRSGIRCDRRHRRRRCQCPECGGLSPATIQFLLRTMHGVAEISTTAIWPTGAGLRAGSGPTYRPRYHEGSQQLIKAWRSPVVRAEFRRAIERGRRGVVRAGHERVLSFAERLGTIAALRLVRPISARIHAALITQTAHVRATQRVRPDRCVSGTGSSNPFSSSRESTNVRSLIAT